MGIFLVVVGFAVYAVCGVVILVKAFRVSVSWGLAVIFLSPFAAIFFVLNHWNDTKAPFLGGLGGAALMILGFLGMPASEPAMDAEDRRTAARARSDDDRKEEPQDANYASAAAPASSYATPSSSYQPASYNPGYAPTPPPPVPVATDTQPPDDDWRPKPKYEQVWVDRQTGEFYAESCKKRPENSYRIPRSVALMQGMTQAPCR